MQAADQRRETLTPRTGQDSLRRPEDTAGGQVAPRTRRDFLKWGLFGSLLLMLGGFGQAFLMFFYPKKLSPFGSKIAVPGTIEDYPLDSVTVVREGKFYLSHVPDGLLALYWKCAHLGCTVPWKPNEEFEGNGGVFHCPCHGSIYLRTGQNVAGPAPRPLDVMEIEVAGGKITVNTKKITKRVRYEPSQAIKV
ncbi:MAG TPA: ubiquinol-cytochrome c reductase iron-sulfur subunit [Chloroflexia bacterium]|nr:ubiquinol-cytochrome c reductase iron-sulfur subunit [Chloroflexia bacterium]